MPWFHLDSKPNYHKPKYNRAFRTAYPVGAERSYVRLSRSLGERFEGIVRDEIVGRINQCDTVHIAELFNGINAARMSAEKVFGSEHVEDALRRIFLRLDFQNTNAVRKHLIRMRHIGEVVLSRMPRERQLAAIVSDNVALIKTIPTKSLGQIGDLVTSAHLSDIRVEDLRDSIMERCDVAKSRAELIARDQIGKRNAELTEAKYRQVGINKYIWSGSLDERERQDHLDLEGQTFSFTDPPVVNQRTGARGNPGEDVQCRCVAIPQPDEAA
jgi:SPP1 gp7 family putative phage head morphogenesis protein